MGVVVFLYKIYIIIMTSRNIQITFWVSQNEFNIIEKNRNECNKTRSKFVRDRALRPDSTNNESVDIIMSFIGKQTDVIMNRINELLNNTIIKKSKEERAYEIAQLNKPKKTDINLIMDTYQMDEKQREQFIESKSKVIDESIELMTELKSVLNNQKQKLEN